MQHCLVTGGAGFIGSHLVEALLRQGHRVRVLDNLSSGSRENLASVLPQINLLEGDIRDFNTVMVACKGINMVFHHAASSSVTESIANPLVAHDHNVTGTLHLLEASRQQGVQKVIMASSAAVYGTDPVMPKHEAMPAVPINPYGLSKYMDELYSELYTGLINLPVVCFRYFNVFGPRQNPNSQYSGVISRFINSVITGEPPVIYGDGYQSRDFVYVSDIVQANLLAMHAPIPGFAVYNVATGTGKNLHDILNVLREETQLPLDVVYKEERRKDIRHSLGDITRIKADLGFAPSVSFAEGLKTLLADVSSPCRRGSRS